MLVGAAKTGKSWLALQVGQAVAQGKPFLGRRTEGQGKVLYLQFDTPDAIWHERLNDLIQAGVELSDNMILVKPGTKAQKFNIQSQSDRQSLEDLIARVNPDLVIIDVLRKIHNTSEDGSTEMKIIFDILNVMLMGMSLLLLHHTAKAPVMQDPNAKLRSPSEAGRGSSFLGGEVDATWLLQLESKTTGLLMIDSRFDDHMETRVVRDPRTNLWVFTETEEPKDISKELTLLCDEFPDMSHYQLVPIVKQRYGLSQASYYRQMKALECRHSQGIIVTSELPVYTPAVSHPSGYVGALGSPRSSANPIEQTNGGLQSHVPPPLMSP